ncbi:hypothetical protein GCM10027572_12860 [Flexivirga lutea]
MPSCSPARDVYIGQLFVCSTRHAAGFADLTMDEAADVGRAIGRWSGVLESAGAEHVYVIRVGHRWPHLHVMLLARWPGTPTDVPWMAVDEWPGARRGSTASASTFAQQLRALAQLLGSP